MLMNTPWYMHHQCPCPQSEPQPPTLPTSPQETLQDQQVGLTQGPMKSLLLQSSKSRVSFSPNPVEFLQSRPAGLQSQMLWGYNPPYSRPPGWGA